MDCSEASGLLPLSIDGELDARTEGTLDTHLADCTACSARRQQLSAAAVAIRAGATYHAAPISLRNSIATKLAAVTAESATNAVPPNKQSSSLKRYGWRLFNSAGWVAAASAVLVLAIVLPERPSAPQQLADELVSSHARALLTGHLVDVASSDQHTVKPWFSGKLDFSPPVRDLAEHGFPLVGGRLDYIDHHSVAVLVYRRRQHLIDVFVAPTASATPVAPARSVQGFNVLAWSAAGMSFRAVSDVDPADLQSLAALL
jgi:anti-sigma factor RsiW